MWTSPSEASAVDVAGRIAAKVVYPPMPLMVTACGSVWTNARRYWNGFNQSLKGTQLPSDPRTLTFDGMFNQSLEDVQLLSSLRTLTFGNDFNQSLQGVQLPDSLQILTLGCNFDQAMEKVGHNPIMYPVIPMPYATP